MRGSSSHQIRSRRLQMKITRSLFRVPFYPLVFAATPVISLFIINRHELQVLDLVRPLLVSLAISVLAWSLSGVFVRSIKKAALAACVLIISVLIYEFAFLAAYSLPGDVIDEKIFLGTWLVLTVLLFGLAVWKLRISQRSFDDLTILLNSFGLALILLATLPAVPENLERLTAPARDPITRPVSEPTDDHWKKAELNDWTDVTRPDVYFLIVDAYARQDILQSRFAYDNSPFLTWLQSEGFFVGDRSHANYSSTHLSLTATLNAEYLHTLLPDSLLDHAPVEHRARSQYMATVLAERYIKRSRVHNLLDAAGYRFVANDSGYAITRKNPNSIGEALTGEITEFEEALLQMTVISPLVASTSEAIPFPMTKHELLLETFGELASIKPHSSPSFVFYHILSPHFPFSFREDGSQMLRHPVYDASAWVEDRSKLDGYREHYAQNYPKNVAGLNLHLKRVIKKILENTNRRAVVILQSDHGSSLGLVPTTNQDTDISERFGILNAIYLPDGTSRTGITAEMSSINTFPLIFNNVFGLDLPTHEDRAFLMDADLGFDEVTDRLQSQPKSDGSANKVGAGR